MTVEADTVTATGTIWASILSLGLLLVGYFAKKRDDRIDANEKAISDQGDDMKTAFAAHAKAHSELQIKIAEEYATKDSMRMLFQETQRAQEAATGRLEKSIDTTNLSVKEVGQKIDKVIESNSTFLTTVMTELSKKT